MSKYMTELVDRFLRWPLPKTVSSDTCVTDRNYPHARCGTNLLTADEARQMMEFVLNSDDKPRELLASRLIDAWCADKGKQIPWAKAVQIVAIVTKQPDAERDRLLYMGDEDGSCGMCGRSDSGELLAALREALAHVEGDYIGITGARALLAKHEPKVPG